LGLCKGQVFFFKKVNLIPEYRPGFQQRLKDAQIIRNRVAHSSSKARHQFRRMTNLNIGEPANSPMDYGFSPGKYLVYNNPEIIFDKVMGRFQKTANGLIFLSAMYICFQK